MACNSTLKMPFTQIGTTLDPVVQITQLLSAAPAGAVDPALLRIDARRFTSVAAVKAALAALPEARREAQAARLRAWLESVPGRVNATGARAGVRWYGWLTPFVCKVRLQDFKMGENETSLWMDLNPVGLAIRMALR
jgi:hypothetical protein